MVSHIYWSVWRPKRGDADFDTSKGEQTMDEKIENSLPQQQSESRRDLDDLIFQGDSWLASDR